VRNCQAAVLPPDSPRVPCDANSDEGRDGKKNGLHFGEEISLEDRGHVKVKVLECSA
jgi:hypothetical protein